jgi:hypothetical protein
MPDIDLFNFFRIWLGWIATIYASIITAQSLYGWYIWLAGQDKYVGMLRRYLIVHGLRLRFKTFWGDVLITLLLTVVFLIMWKAHHDLYDLKQRVAAGYRQEQVASAMKLRLGEKPDDGAQHP